MNMIQIAERPRAARAEAGFAIVPVLFVVLLLSGLSVGLLQEGMAGRAALENHRSNLRALEVAETGIVRAEAELRAQVDLDGGGIGAVSGLYAEGAYTVGVQVQALAENRWILTAEGEFGLSTRRLEVGVRRRSGSTWADALFSDDSLPLSSVTTDAYDSALGTYASQAVNADAAGPYAEPGGGLGSNQDMVLDGSTVWVRGAAIPGPEHDVLVSGNPTVTGDMAPRTFNVLLDPTPEADFISAMNSNQNQTGLTADGHGNSVRYNAASHTMSIAGNTSATMQGGTYFFKDFDIRGGSILNVTGPVKIYITGRLDVGAGASILASSAADVRIYAHPYALSGAAGAVAGDAYVKVSGGSNVTWALYGPEATLDIGGGNSFYGAAVANHIELQGNNAFHYDKALGRQEWIHVASIERLYWKEIGPPVR